MPNYTYQNHKLKWKRQSFKKVGNSKSLELNEFTKKNSLALSDLALNILEEKIYMPHLISNNTII